MEQPGAYHSIQNEENGRGKANGLAIITRLIDISGLIDNDRIAPGALAGGMTVRLVLVLLARTSVLRVRHGIGADPKIE